MTQTLRSIFEYIDIKKDYSDIDFSGFNVDLQGWGSEHQIFNEAIGASNPSVIIEVGSWKGHPPIICLIFVRQEGLIRKLFALILG